MKTILKFEFFSLAFVSVFGILLHFSYEWTNSNLIVALFSAVNESIWEHLKLLFFPSIFTFFLARLLNIGNGNYYKVKLNGIIIGMIFIVVFYYTYTGIIGVDYPILDISSFFIATIISELYILFKYDEYKFHNIYISYLIIILICTLFFVFTFKPLHINLFLDPLEKKYGILK